MDEGKSTRRSLTICRVGASVLELPIHLGERAWLAEAVDAAVAAWLGRQAVRRAELAAVGAGVEALEQAPRVQQHAVDRAGHTTRCTCILQFLVEQAGRILSLYIYIYMYM